MGTFIGVKKIEARPGVAPKGMGSYGKGSPGMNVTYKDGYESWSPAKIFEDQHIAITGENNTVSQADVDRMIAKTEVMTIGDKTTLVQVTLLNGFTLEETSSCVDPANYNKAMGADMCLKKIKDKIWFLMGFLFQSAIYGFDNK